MRPITIEEVREHCATNGYTDAAISKIMGFLIGAGLKGDSEVIKTRRGECTWDDFYRWVKGEEVEEEHPLCTLLNDLTTRIKTVKNEKKREKLQRQLDFLVEEFGVVFDEE